MTTLRTQTLGSDIEHQLVVGPSSLASTAIEICRGQTMPAGNNPFARRDEHALRGSSDEVALMAYRSDMTIDERHTCCSVARA